MKTWKSTVQHNIKGLRETMGWSQVQLAQKASTSQKTVSRIENWEADPDYSPEYEAIKAIASAFGLEPAHLESERLDWKIVLQPKRSSLAKLVEVWNSLDEDGRSHLEKASEVEARIAKHKHLSSRNPGSESQD